MKKNAEGTVTKFINYSDRSGNHSLPVSVIRSKRKTGFVIVNADGSAELRIPLRTSDSAVNDMLKGRAQWIVDKHNEMIIKENALKSSMPELTEAERTLLEKRYKKAASDFFPLRVQHFEKIMGVHHKKIVIRDQKTRWGSCSTSGTLSFNWRLIMAPPEVLDYVVVHELAHFTHMDHSKAFWATVESVMPDYDRHRKWLNEHGQELRI
ncbi:M48 family metallopeptidase [Butyrivibrio sp.]|uniref:M48 family metallopeptidase n=1 Tax=Butyrivibrio sp. TaxID=28121 RepID=UPI0025E7F30A|nr:M48 family metallopeptidase [Butyrivibrio sp.]